MRLVITPDVAGIGFDDIFDGVCSVDISQTHFVLEPSTIDTMGYPSEIEISVDGMPEVRTIVFRFSDVVHALRSSRRKHYARYNVRLSSEQMRKLGTAKMSLSLRLYDA